MTAFAKPRSTTETPLRQRARDLMTREISFIHSREFETLTESQLRGDIPASIHDPTTAVGPNGGRNLVSGSNSALLTPEGERYLFRKMNFLKFRANVLRSRLNPSRPRKKDIEAIERCLAEAEQVFAEIIQANLRLAAGLAFELGRSRDEVDELIAEANLILVNAAEKFDYSRGFRFSTYATLSIKRHFFRLLQRNLRRRRREVQTATETFVERVPAPETDDAAFDPRLATLLIEHFDECLDPREREIIEARFGLTSSRPDTLASLANQIGLSKERVRQIQLRAIDKLQQLAVRLNLSRDDDAREYPGNGTVVA